MRGIWWMSFNVIFAISNAEIYMRRYLIIIVIAIALPVICIGQERVAPHIGTFPPQMHQQICQESTFIRYMDVFNTGDATLSFTAGFSPNPVSWVTATPLSGEIQPGDTSLIEFDFNSTGLPLDNYYIDFLISSNDPDNPEVVVLTMLHVQDLTILLTPDEDSICMGCSTQLNTIVFGCSEQYSFSWASDPPGFSSTEKSPVVSPQVNTLYTVTVTDGGYSKQKSVEIKVYGTTGLIENQSMSNVTVYPNPCDEQVTVKFISELKDTGMICISDLTGRLIHSQDIIINEGPNELTIRTGDFEKGVYLLSLLSAHHQFTIRLVVA
jgi:hypothetical protein